METEFKYKSGQYAKKLGISKEALRSRRRRGELENEYIVQNNITLWREPASKASSNQAVNNQVQEGSAHASSTKILAARSKAKRIGVVEAGIKTNYPNQAFKQHNEIKMLARLQRSVDSEIQELLPEAIEQAKRIKEQRQQQMQKQLMQPVRRYGQMLTGVQYTSPKNSSGWNTVFEKDRKIEEENRPPKKKFPEYY
jgi:TPP-dependent indolepyruvate ferredoxin oxidoreductase alpha subunit